MLPCGFVGCSVNDIHVLLAYCGVLWNAAESARLASFSGSPPPLLTVNQCEYYCMRLIYLTYHLVSLVSHFIHTHQVVS